MRAAAATAADLNGPGGRGGSRRSRLGHQGSALYKREEREALEREGESEMLFCLFWEK